MRPDRYAARVRSRFFFFQAEDGIRDLTVTGVQTCALPISMCASSAENSKRDCRGALRRLAMTGLPAVIASEAKQSPANTERTFDGQIHQIDRGRGAAADDQHRYRQDLSGRLSEDDQAHRACQIPVRRDPLPARWLGKPRFRAEPGPLSQRQ